MKNSRRPRVKRDKKYELLDKSGKPTSIFKVIPFEDELNMELKASIQFMRVKMFEHMTKLTFN